MPYCLKYHIQTMLPQHGEIKSIQVWFVGSHVVSVTLQKRESHFSSVVEVWFSHWEACKQKCDRNHALWFESSFFVGAIILAVISILARQRFVNARPAGDMNSYYSAMQKKKKAFGWFSPEWTRKTFVRWSERETARSDQRWFLSVCFTEKVRCRTL